MGDRSQQKKGTLQTQNNNSPRDINVGGIHLYQLRDNIKKQFPSMDCAKENNEKEYCTIRISRANRHGRFQDIDRLYFSFVHDTLRSIKLRYAQIFDIEYLNLVADLEKTYGSATSITPDSSHYLWDSDSLNIILEPNRKPHWTGSLMTFTPLVEFTGKF
ncbi:MAG: hypothetical protein HYR76_04755 [Ignavibacteria bacterium]|nr:hypothetical protein [Ignavibacteria bacterium]